jgi:hypothetical protein
MTAIEADVRHNAASIESTYTYSFPLERIMGRIGQLLLAICRAVYCWVFFLTAFMELMSLYYAVPKGVHSISGVDVYVSCIFAAYSVVSCIAWWKVLRHRPASRGWAIAANLTYIFHYAPGVIVRGDWSDFVRTERDWWPVVLLGILGIIVFTFPYNGWRKRSLSPAS